MTGPSDKDARNRRSEVGKRFASRYDELGPEELAAGAEWSIDEPQSALFLGTYSEAGIRRVAEIYGLIELVKVHGIETIDVEIDTRDPFLHVLKLKEEDGAVFFELRARTALGRDLGLPGKLADLPFYVVEWLSIENPHGAFSRARPPLPGQRHPGLGIGPEVEEILVLGARRQGSAALVSWPQWYHNAFLYHPRWMFVDPREEGRFAALRRDLAGYSLPRVAWAVHLGCVRDAQGRAFEWQPGPLVLPRTREAFRYFETPIYRATRFATKARSGFELDEAALDRALAERDLDLP
ncbi:hypothetical protein [Vulgatibacter sp.]|uniref:hypothetical protein n=1 Tax=Vulgatibacter sp. TaxID=1971226 RepID=UPI0035615531